MKTTILVAAHKKFPMPKSAGYLPILVGAKKNYKPDIPFQRDDQGINISEKNPNYNELTAVFWAWKNLNSDAIGLVHYRRLFFNSKPHTLDNVMQVSEMNKLLSDFDILLPKKRNYYIESNYSHYVHAHHKEPLDETRKVIEKLYPDYLPAFDRVMNDKKAHMFNMFVMKKEAFNSYASFLFSVLEEVEKRIDISSYSVSEKRVFGYLSELLMDVWLYSNDYTYKDISWAQLGKKQYVKKGIYFLARKVGIRTRTHF